MRQLFGKRLPSNENGGTCPSDHPLIDSVSTRWLILLAFLLIASGILRFYKLDAVGLQFFDDFTYTTVAYRWSLGEFINNWAKPGYHLLGAAAFKVFGIHDYSLAYLNSCCDVLTVLLIFLVGKRLGMSSASSFSAAFLYAFSPRIIIWSRSALTHMPSAMLLLFSFLMLLNYLKGKRNIVYLVLSGLSASYAGHVHPTLFSFIPYFGFIIVVSCLRFPMRRQNILTALSHVVIFGVSSAVVFAGFCLLLLNNTQYNESGVIATVINGVIGPLFQHYDVTIVRAKPSFPSALLLSLRELTALILYPTFIFGCVALGSLLVRAVIDKLWQLQGEVKRAFWSDAKYLAIMWALVPYFMVIYSLSGKRIYSRMMIPLAPFFILSATFSAELALRKWKHQYAQIILYSVSLLIVTVNFIIDWPTFVPKMIEPTIYRQVGNVLHGKVDDENRLLITPSTVRKSGDGYTFYLSGNFYYIPMGETAHEWNMNESLINKKRLKKNYFFIPYNWDRNLFSSLRKELHIRYVLVCTDHFKIKIPGYNPRVEQVKLQECLDENQAVPIYTSSKIVIYEFPQDL